MGLYHLKARESSRPKNGPVLGDPKRNFHLLGWCRTSSNSTSKKNRFSTFLGSLSLRVVLRVVLCGCFHHPPCPFSLPFPKPSPFLEAWHSLPPESFWEDGASSPPPPVFWTGPADRRSARPEDGLGRVRLDTRSIDPGRWPGALKGRSPLRRSGPRRWPRWTNAVTR